MYATQEKKIVQDYEAFEGKDGSRYPWNFPKQNITELHKVTETPIPTEENIVVTGYTVNDDFVQVWTTRQKTEEEKNKERTESIKSQICNIESTVTQRRLREAVLTEEGKQWLNAVEDQISTLRGQL